MHLGEEYDSSGCRRLWALISTLPPEAALWRLRQSLNTTSIREFVSRNSSRVGGGQ